MNPPRNLSDVTTSSQASVTFSSLYEDQTSIVDGIRGPGGPDVFDADEDWRRETPAPATAAPFLFPKTSAQQLSTRIDSPITVESKTDVPPLLSTTTSFGNVGKNNNTAKFIQRSKGRTKGSKSTVISTDQRDNMTGHSLQLTINSLADLDHPEHFNLDITDGKCYFQT